MKEEFRECPHCSNSSNMKMVANGKHQIDNEDVEMWLKFEWGLFFCEACHEVHLLQESVFSEDWDGEDGFTTKTVQLYPEKFKSASIPKKILAAYSLALQANDNILCCIALRRTLEMICKEQGETTGTLEAKIEALHSRKIIPATLKETADLLRKLGNAGAHGDDFEIDDRSLDDLKKFTQYIMEYIYVLPAKIMSLKLKK